MSALLLVLALAGSAAPQGNDLSQDALNAANAAVDRVDDWVNQATALEAQLKGVQATVTKVEKTQRILNEAVRSGSIPRLRDAVGEWKPEWKANLEKLEDVQLLILKIDPSYAPKVQKMDDALRFLGGKAQELNGRVISSWQATGLAGHIQTALDGNGPFGRAIRAGRALSGAWSGLKTAKDQYDSVLGQIETLFEPNAKSSTAGLEAIQRILNKFKDSAPPPVDAILGGYADVVGGFVSALKRLDSVISRNARQMVLNRNFDSTKDGILDALLRRNPTEDVEFLEEIRAPAFLKGRFFRRHATLYYLWHEGTMYMFEASLEEITHCARLIKEAKGGGSYRELENFSKGWNEKYERWTQRFSPYYFAFQAPMMTILEYAKRLNPGDKAGEDLALKHIREILPWNFEQFMAHAIFNGDVRDNILHFGDQFREKILVDVSASGSGEGFDFAKLSVWAQGNNWSATGLRGEDGTYTGLIRINENTHTIYAGGSHEGAGIKQASTRAPTAPGWARLTLRIEMQPEEEEEEEEPGGEEDGIDVTRLGEQNETGEPDPEPEPGEDEEDPVPGVPSGEGEKPEGDEDKGVDEEDVDEMKDKADEDTDPGESRHETDEEFGGRPDDPDSDLYDQFLDALLTGNIEGAIQIFQRMTGCDRATAERAVGELTGDVKTTEQFTGNNAPEEEPYDGPDVPADEVFVRDEEVDPADLDNPVDPDADPDAPGEDDLAVPDAPAPPGAPDFERERRDANTRIRDIARGQQAAAAAEVRAGQAAVRTRPIPTRGGMAGIDVGADARTITVKVWDHGAQDGDRVSVAIGGRVVAGNLTLTKGGHTFTAPVGGMFTDVKIVALNEGDSPPNTASFQVFVDGKPIKTTKWSLGTNGVGSTGIRRALR